MEFYTVESDGNGNIIIYPTFIIGAGLLIFGIFALIQNAITGADNRILEFANESSWIVVIIIAVLSVLISIIIGIFGNFRFYIPILFCISLILSLSVSYAVTIDILVSALENGFLVMLMAGPLLFVFWLFLEVLIMALGFAVFAPNFFEMIFEKKVKQKIKNIVSPVCAVVSIVLLVYGSFETSLITFLF